MYSLHYYIRDCASKKTSNINNQESLIQIIFTLNTEPLSHLVTTGLSFQQNTQCTLLIVHLFQFALIVLFLISSNISSGLHKGCFSPKSYKFSLKLTFYEIDYENIQMVFHQLNEKILILSHFLSASFLRLPQSSCLQSFLTQMFTTIN